MIKETEHKWQHVLFTTILAYIHLQHFGVFDVPCNCTLCTDCTQKMFTANYEHVDRKWRLMSTLDVSH